MTKTIKIKNIKIGGKNQIVLIAGPCVIESEKSALMHAEKIKKICAGQKIAFIFKSSYDKANRSSINSYRGPGLIKGLNILEKIKSKLGIPILSDVHCRQEIPQAAEILDIIQVPAFLSRQTDFIQELAKTEKVINVKKGQFLAPWDIENIIKKIEMAGNKNILITERGSSFGYNNLVADMRALPIMRGFGYPVIFDATHSLQLPGEKGISSGGMRELIPNLARSAVACGCDGLFIEVHERPDKALCDGPNTLALNQLGPLLEQIKKIDKIAKGGDR